MFRVASLAPPRVPIDVNFKSAASELATNAFATTGVLFRTTAALAADTVGVSPFNTSTLTANGDPAIPAAVIVKAIVPEPEIVPTIVAVSTCAVPEVGAAAIVYEPPGLEYWAIYGVPVIMVQVGDAKVPVFMWYTPVSSRIRIEYFGATPNRVPAPPLTGAPAVW
jgi:hypothetical protein